ncbi:MAG: UbiA family prenyltransferase [Sandaracinus sp.]
MSTVRDLIALARLRGLFLVSLLPVLGYSWAYWDHGCEAVGWTAVPRLLWLATIWGIPHLGTMWLNAALDRDESATLYGRAAKIPPHIERYAYVTLAISLGLALATDVGLALCVIGCALLSVLYSHPKTAWKGHAVLGPATNAVGYGVLSPLGGFLYTGFPPTIRGGLVLATAVPWMLTAYFAAQAFQEDEDKSRGYRTLVALAGPVVTLRVTRITLWISLAASAALAIAGIVPRLVLVPLPLFFLLDRHLVRWSKEPNGGDAGWAGRFFARLAGVALLVLVAACADYELAMHSRSLPGGLATASGLWEPRVCAHAWPAWSLEHRDHDR